MPQFDWKLQSACKMGDMMGHLPDMCFVQRIHQSVEISSRDSLAISIQNDRYNLANQKRRKIITLYFVQLKKERCRSILCTYRYVTDVGLPTRLTICL